MFFNLSVQLKLTNHHSSQRRLASSLGVAVWGGLLVAAWVVSADFAFCQDSNTNSSSVSALKSENGDSGAGFSPMRGNWKAASFGGDGPIYFHKTESGGERIEMYAGDPITGIRWTGKFPKDNYEIRLEARRVEGFDFFAALTFPVADEHCSFVLGGWGGGMVGISSIDGMDASSNQTTQYKEFETNQWYKIRVRVDEMAVTCWIDDEEYAVVPRGDHTLSIRIEMDPSLPLGIANYMTRSELRNIEMRVLNAEAAEVLGVSDVTKKTNESDASDNTSKENKR
ncbi:family 16 glycoside hydrolase [Rhodopirellula sallentina]|uniref:Signal peptide protein n=1 Tax=Rhodopirellula sallentina SM41 TaxID=1263870 RepID=M5UL62_9BACT|nr:family 16 glycoside hydrolase [Rhodopirellula sallentina]EMI56738.1 signal peptide protein [Rhodopirellula sallentina SM41]